MPSTYKVGVVFDGLGPGSFRAASSALPEATFSEASGVTTVRARIRPPGPAGAVSQLVEHVTKVAPAAVPLRVDQDLVSVSDIAHRVGRTRESVRLLVDGKRGPGSFPPPVGVVCESIRVWPWSVVLEWFDKVLGVDLDEHGVPPEAAALLDASFAARKSPALAAALGRASLTWANQVPHSGG
jgi:hypothetical protein